MIWSNIINHYYQENGTLRSILQTHSEMVARKAVVIAESHPQLGIDIDFVFAAALLHDIGIVRCDAPGISCYGTEHYLCHGIIGAQMLREYAAEHGIAADVIEPYARVCERHTGAGITRADIAEQNLPLPDGDYLPETLEEKLICYADKFYSKTRLTNEKTLEQVIASIQRFGSDSEKRFMQMHEIFK